MSMNPFLIPPDDEHGDDEKGEGCFVMLCILLFVLAVVGIVTVAIMTGPVG